MRKLILLSSVALALAAGSARADLIECVNCSVFDLTGRNFDPLTNPGSVTNTSKILVADAPGEGLQLNHLADLSFDYLGKEAGYTNQFGFGSNVLFSTGGSGKEGPSGSTSFVNDVVAGFLNFFFQTNGVNGSKVTNGSVVDDGLPYKYPSTLGFFKESDNGTTSSWILFFNDAGGGPDKDFDDMLIRLTATYDDGGNSTTPVPLPATLPLLGAGLAGLGVLKRMRTRSSNRG